MNCGLEQAVSYRERRLLKDFYSILFLGKMTLLVSLVIPIGFIFVFDGNWN